MFVTVAPRVAPQDIPVTRQVVCVRIIFQRLRNDTSELFSCKVIQKKVYCETPVVYVKEQAAAPLEQHLLLQPVYIFLVLSRISRLFD